MKQRMCSGLQVL